MALFWRVPETPTKERVRASDPLSSVIAAEGASGFSGSHKERICNALQALGQGTAHSIAEKSGLTVVQVDRRLPELKRDGVAEVVESPPGYDLIVDGFRVWRLKKI